MKKDIKKHSVLIAILLLTFLVFSPVTQNDFLTSWDDQDQILGNVSVKNISWENVKYYFSSYVLQSYQPLATLSFAVEYYLVKKNATFFHFNNLILHLLNIILVWLLLKRLFSEKKYLCIFVTAIFAIHPLQTETIAWLSARSTLLYTLFLLLASVFYIKHLENKTYKITYLYKVILFFILALFSKSAAIVFPGILIAFDYFYGRKINAKTILEKIPFIIISLVFGYFSLKSRGVTGGLVDTFIGQLGYDFYDRIFISCYSFLFYIFKFIFPLDLYHLYGYPIKFDGVSLPFIFKISPYILMSLFVIFIIIYKKSSKIFRKQLAFGLLFYVITIFLVLNIVAFLAYITAERYMYISIIGLAICFWLLTESVFRRNKKWEYNVYGIVVVFLILLCFKSYNQTKIWKNSLTLFTYVTETYADKDFKDNSAFKIWQILAGIYNKKGDVPKVIKCYSGAIKFKRDEPFLYLYRGYAQFSIQKYGLAIKDFDELINSKLIRQEPEVRGIAFTNRAYAKDILAQKRNDKQLMKEVLVDIDSALNYDRNDTKLLNKRLEVINRISK